ncbi:MAG: alpha-hydroxy acid oxidase [Actinomycetota bacterium]
MTLPLTVGQFEAQAAEILSAGSLGYYAGGAGDEITLVDNVAAWQRIALRPRVMVDVSQRDMRTTVLGRQRAHPLIVAPTAFHKLATPEGEVATARAALGAQATYCLSSLATTDVTTLAQKVPDANRWLQLYVFKDRGVTAQMVDAAVAGGYEAIVLTVDMPELGIRERDLHTGFVIDLETGVPHVSETGASGLLTMSEVVDLIDPSLTWSDVEALAHQSGLPILVKGILEPADARLAVEHGAAGVVVSNHGGRQLDGVLSGADALAGVVDEVGGEIDVIVDGGIRRGSDILKALAIGAAAVQVGRPILWGLTVGGEEGARRVLELLLKEFDNALALAGVPVAADLNRDIVMPAPWVI